MNPKFNDPALFGGTFQIAVGNDEQGTTVIEEGMLPGVPLFRPVQRNQDRGRINAQRPAHVEKFHDVQPPLIAFYLGDKGLGTAQPVSKHLLRQPGLIPSGSDGVDEPAILLVVDALRQPHIP